MQGVGIIVLNWQGWQDTLACLESLRQLSYLDPISLIVCDNASGDDSCGQILTWAQQHYAPSEIGWFNFDHENLSINSINLPGSIVSHAPPSAQLPFILIQTGANLGFAGGNNVGIRYALARQQFEYLWILNNDTTVDSQSLSALCKCAAAHPQIALFGSTLVDYYQRQVVQCAGGCRYFPLLTIFRQVLGGQPLHVALQQKEAFKLDYISGASMFLRVAAIQQVGLFNEEYFLFYEELDYTQRLKRQGYDIGWCKQSLVYHKGSASVGSVREANREKLRRANYYENLSTLKYTANFYPKLLPLVMLLRFGLKSLALLSRGDFYLFQPLLQAYRDFIRARFWKKR